MTTLQELHHRMTSTKEHDKMLRSVAPLSDYFGVNHFYWMRIISKGDSGRFFCLGSHTKWHEFLYDKVELMSTLTIIRHPENLKTGVILMNETAESNKCNQLAWDKFNINFTINIQKKIPEGIESFGFGLKSKQAEATQHLINHLPLLHKFSDYFSSENQKLILLAREFQVDTSLFGPRYYEKQESLPVGSPKPLLKMLGLEVIETLTRREIEVLKFLAYGFPASYIAEQVHLSPRTVQNHIENLKMKLNCESKVSLIKKAHDLASFLPSQDLSKKKT